MKELISKILLLIFFTHFIIYPNSFFTKQKSYEAGGSFYFMIKKEGNYNIYEKNFKPEFKIFLFNYVYISPNITLYTGDIIISKTFNSGMEFPQTNIDTDSCYDYNTVEIGINLGFAYGKNWFLIPYIESGLSYVVNNTALIIEEEITTTFADGSIYYNEQLYGPENQKYNFFIIPAEIGIKFPFVKHLSLTFGVLHNFYLDNLPFYYDNKGYKNHIKLKMMFTGIFY